MTSNSFLGKQQWTRKVTLKDSKLVSLQCKGVPTRPCVSRHISASLPPRNSSRFKDLGLFYLVPGSQSKSVQRLNVSDWSIKLKGPTRRPLFFFFLFFFFSLSLFYFIFILPSVLSTLLIVCRQCGSLYLPNVT